MGRVLVISDDTPILSTTAAGIVIVKIDRGDEG